MDSKMMASNGTPIDTLSAESGNWLRKGYFQKVERLNIKNVGGGPLMLNDICIEKPPLVLQTLTSLRELCIENCSNLISFSEVCFLSNLSKLEIINCKVGSLLPEEKMLNNANIESLKIEGCHLYNSL
ncbi:hypothetical protein Ddye_011540 [Dipteronia dyeriana]|uniref:Uncharacterized protein n=1 Tax=Dipteronia dyeriana TaxID=168575 RepID=A0AAE0CH45_9ROSI|nr:hypothetical protein Ddye_011540 [Dipteronia dyeriana]